MKRIDTVTEKNRPRGSTQSQKYILKSSERDNTHSLFEKHLKSKVNNILRRWKSDSINKPLEGIKPLRYLKTLRNEEIKEEASDIEESLNTSYYSNYRKQNSLKIKGNPKFNMKRKKFGLENKNK
mmetsp:Transcript_28753/g.25453  ORF Transcript_28753/g.25453 Transcript_28753/m.25453 type:complete len:125 (+) Transcript_28753:306-680(+)